VPEFVEVEASHVYGVLGGATIRDVRRIGKTLFVDVSGGHTMGLTFGLRGWLMLDGETARADGTRRSRSAEDGHVRLVLTVDEILFQGKIDPRRTASTISAGELDDLWLGVRRTRDRVLARNGSHQGVQIQSGARERGASCPRCGVEVERVKVGGRTTYFCPRTSADPTGSPRVHRDVVSGA
jgi:formamidopyrimidine-DNA glycosylase